MTVPKLNRPLVVAVGAFDENSGGAIVLHKLVDNLRRAGVSAYAYPPLKPYPNSMPAWKRRLKGLHRHITKVAKLAKHFSHPSMDVPLAPLSVLKQDPIVVYPEVIAGNPLGASSVVRWILFTPGAHTGQGVEIDRGAEEIFYFQKAFIEGHDWIPPENELRLQWIRSDIYYDQQQENRSGSCRMQRKGALLNINTSDAYRTATPLDGLPHQEIAAIFNKSERFYCDDPHTMYSTYAVLCGCIAVVTPVPGLSEADWRPEQERWGIAYGDKPDQIEIALRTKHLMKETLDALQGVEEQQVEHFIATLAKRFE